MVFYFQIDRKIGVFYDFMKRSFMVYYICMYLMFNMGNISVVGIKLYYKDVLNGGRKMDSLVQSVEF